MNFDLRARVRVSYLDVFSAFGCVVCPVHFQSTNVPFGCVGALPDPFLAWPLSGRVSSFAYNSRHLPWSCTNGERKCTWPGFHGFLRIPITPLQTAHIFSPFLLVLFMLRQARKFYMLLRSSEQPILGWTLSNPLQGIQEPGIPELSWSFAIVRTKAWHLLALPHEV